jgi:hypothetical protein
VINKGIISPNKLLKRKIKIGHRFAIIANYYFPLSKALYT